MAERETGRLARPTEWADVHRLVVHVCRCRRPAGRQQSDHEDIVQDALYLALRRYRRCERYAELDSVPACMLARYAVQDALAGRGYRLRGLPRRRRVEGLRQPELVPSERPSLQSMILRVAPKGGV